MWDSLTLQITSCSPIAYAWDYSISVFILTLFENIASTPFHCQPLEIWILPPFKLKSLSQMSTLTINVKCKGPFSTSSPSFEDTTTCLLPISHYFPKSFAISYCTLDVCLPQSSILVLSLNYTYTLQVPTTTFTSLVITPNFHL